MMLKNYRTTFSLAVILLSAFSAFAQNRFEGFNLFLDAPDNQKSQMCALRYSTPQTDITVTDLNSATPTRLTNCSDASAMLRPSGATAMMRASQNNYKWCFTGEDKIYQISFQGDPGKPRIVYNWIAAPETPGIYNLKEFGAKGDGTTDDTVPLKSALAFIASRGGGTLQIPEGDFLITSTLTLPSGVIIQGISPVATQAQTNNVITKNPSRLKLRGANRALFRIGECTENVVIKDVELYGESTEKTFGIEAVGGFISSQHFYFERVVFSNFFRGFYAHFLPVNSNGWQFDFVKFNHCRFVYNTDAGIYTDVWNSDWKIEGSFFNTPQRTATVKGDAMHFEHAGMILVQDTFAGSPSGIGGTFLDITDCANLTVISSQAERITNAIVYNGAKYQSAGDYSYPITIINSIFGAPIIFNARRTFVSMGNLYVGGIFQADEQLRVYSTGDRFCYDGSSPFGCQNISNRKNFDRATVIFMTGQPDDGTVKGRPTFFGTDVQFGTPIQTQSILQNALPSGKPNGSLVYCSNCRRNTTPCQAGGTGAPAMVVAGQWSCL